MTDKTEITLVVRVARMLDPEAYAASADEHIQWCAGYKMRLDQDARDWRDHQYFGQQYAQRRREAEAKAAQIITVVEAPANVG